MCMFVCVWGVLEGTEVRNNALSERRTNKKEIKYLQKSVFFFFKSPPSCFMATDTKRLIELWI